MSEHLCLTCDRAVWQKTPTGRLHPNGQGKCDWTPEHIPTPAAWNWGGWTPPARQPKPQWGQIERKPGARAVTECETYERKP